MRSFKESLEPKEIHAPGTRVAFPHKGKMTSGKVVRYEKGSLHRGAPFYVVYHGETESAVVPAHKVEKYTSLGETVVPKFETPIKNEQHYTGRINNKTYVVPHAFKDEGNGGLVPMRHAIVTALNHTIHNNPSLTPEEHAKVNAWIITHHGEAQTKKLANLDEGLTVRGTAQTYNALTKRWDVQNKDYPVGMSNRKRALNHVIKKLQKDFPDHKEHEATIVKEDLKADWNRDFSKNRRSNIRHTLKQQIAMRPIGKGNKAWRRADKEDPGTVNWPTMKEEYEYPDPGPDFSRNIKRIEQGKMLHCFTCGKPRIFKNDGKLKCPVCKTKKVIGEDAMIQEGGPNRKSHWDVATMHQTKIAKDTLRMPDAMVGVMGGMDKEQARHHLKHKIGWTDAQIHNHEHGYLSESAYHKLQDLKYHDKPKSTWKRGMDRVHDSEQQSPRHQTFAKSDNCAYCRTASKHSKTEHDDSIVYHHVNPERSRDDHYIEEAANFMTTYKRNETQNRHTANIAHLAKHFGDEGDKAQAKFFMDELKKHGHNKHHEACFKLHDKLWPKATKAHTYSERTLTPSEESKKEEIVVSMKKNIQGFKERYGDDAKSVMYATATKHAKELAESEQLDESVKGRMSHRRLFDNQSRFTVKWPKANTAAQASNTKDRVEAGSKKGLHAYKVHYKSKEIDKVFYGSHQDPADVKKSLVNHDGYHPDIKVTKERSKSDHRDVNLGDRAYKGHLEEGFGLLFHDAIQLDELSKSTLKSYIPKASISLSNTAYRVGHREAQFGQSGSSVHKSQKSDRRKEGKRLTGIRRASERLEESDTLKTVKSVLSEVFTRQHYKQIANLIKGHADSKTRQQLANTHAAAFAKDNPRFSHEKFHAAAGTTHKKD